MRSKEAWFCSKSGKLSFRTTDLPSIQGIFSSGIRPQKSCDVFFFSKEKSKYPKHTFASFIYTFISSNSLVIRRLKFFSSIVPSVLLHKGMYSSHKREQILSYFLCTLSPLWGKQHAMFQQRCFLHRQIQFFQS